MLFFSQTEPLKLPSAQSFQPYMGVA